MRYPVNYAAKRRREAKEIINCGLMVYGTYAKLSRESGVYVDSLKKFAHGESTPQVKSYKKLKNLEKRMWRLGR